MMVYSLFSVNVMPLKESDKSAVSSRAQQSTALEISHEVYNSRLLIVTQLLVTTNFFTPFS